MSLVGPSLYEWISHNLFVVALAVGALIVMALFIINVGRKKGRYRL
ncbi:EYxxD motif small membrane protein [Brevibacillus sp. SYSU BS000544]